jgi:hypothetical protein
VDQRPDRRTTQDRTRSHNTHPVDPGPAPTTTRSSSTGRHDRASEIHTTTDSAFARADIHTAVGAHDDAHRRRQYAQSALSYANTVLLAPDATDEQRRYAGYYQEDALAMIAGA